MDRARAEATRRPFLPPGALRIALRSSAEAALLVASALLLLPDFPASGTERVSLKEWYTGPVRYILSRREEKEFRSLEDDASRALFVRDFWRARDPVPATPENEARMAFWQRVADANHLFNESARPGWLTDRGRIYILLGPPNDIQQDLNFRLPSGTSSDRGLIRWIYHGKVLTGQHEPTFIVVFTPDPSGDWRLSDDALLSSVYFDPLALGTSQEGNPLLSRIQSVVADSISGIGAAMDLGRLTTPADETALIDTVSSESFFAALPLSARWDTYPGSGDGRTLVVVTAFVPRGELSVAKGEGAPRPLVLGRIEGEKGERIDLGEYSFAAADENSASPASDLLLFQARTLAPPGRYRAYVGLFDTITYRAGCQRGTVEIPDFPPGRLGMSTITPLRHLAPVTRRSDAGYSLPFILGDLRAVPRERPVFPRSGELSVYFQLALPAGAKGNRLELRFFRREGGALLPAGSPQNVPDPSPVQGWSFPLTGWPPGEYRLVVMLEGGEEQQTASQSLDFEVGPD